MSEPQYYISEGVRRAVAARELGLITIKAKLVVGGRPDQYVYVSSDQLHSPKDSVSISHGRYQIVLQGMSTPTGRSRMPAIEIEPLGIPGQTGSIPLSQVRLEP